MTSEAMNTDVVRGRSPGRSPSASDQDTIGELNVLAPAAGDAFEKAPAAAGEGSGQPAPKLPPPGIEVKEEVKEESRDANREPDGSTAARDGVTNLTPPNGSTDDAVMKLLADELEQTKQDLQKLQSETKQDFQKLQSEKNKADTDARLARARLAAAEAENRDLLQKKVDLEPEPDSLLMPRRLAQIAHA